MLNNEPPIKSIDFSFLQWQIGKDEFVRKRLSSQTNTFMTNLCVCLCGRAGQIYGGTHT